MADKEKINSENEHKNLPVVVEAAPRHSRKWVLSIVAIVVVVYLILAVGGLWFLHSVADHRDGASSDTRTTMAQHGQRGLGNGERTYTVRQSSSDGLTTTTTNTTYTQTQGVVTAVNGDSIVVAGGGKTQTIKTNSSTTYVDDTKAAVNDTVVVVGTKDGDTITATQIAVYN